MPQPSAWFQTKVFHLKNITGINTPEIKYNSKNINKAKVA